MWPIFNSQLVKFKFFLAQVAPYKWPLQGLWKTNSTKFLNMVCHLMPDLWVELLFYFFTLLLSDYKKSNREFCSYFVNVLHHYWGPPIFKKTKKWSEKRHSTLFPTSPMYPFFGKFSTAPDQDGINYVWLHVSWCFHVSQNYILTHCVSADTNNA